MKAKSLVFIFFIFFFLAGCSNDNLYSGEKKDGLPHGTGVMKYPNGTVYEGEFYLGQRSGEGRWVNTDGITYQGNWKDDLYYGFGTLTIPQTITYEGYWEKGMRQGQGIQTWEDGRRYEGSWHLDQIHGQGTIYYPDGSRYTGEWFQGKKEGSGTLYQADGEVLEGQWVNDQFVYTPVQKINLFADRLVLQENTPSYSLEFEVLPHDASDPTLEWASSDLEVAEIIEGEIFPRSQGEAVITARSAADGVTARSEIIIIPATVYVAYIELERTLLNLRVNDEPVFLEAKVFPPNATDQSLTWSSNNPQIASVNQGGLVTPQSSGETVITVQSADGSGASARCTVIVSPLFPSSF